MPSRAPQGAYQDSVVSVRALLGGVGALTGITALSRAKDVRWIYIKCSVWLPMLDHIYRVLALNLNAGEP